MRHITILVLLLLHLTSFAQKDTGYVKDVKIYLSKEFTPKEISTLTKFYDSVNDTYIGKQYVPFILKTTNGDVLTNESIKGKVTFIAFWNASYARTWEYDKLNRLYDSLHKNPAFEFISVAIQENLLDEFVKEHDPHYPITFVRDKHAMDILNYSNGIPSFVIIDKDGKIVLVRRGGITEKDQFIGIAFHRIYALINWLLIR